MNPNVSKLLLYGASTVLAACSILYELLIAQTMSLLAANTVIWYSVTIGLYLIGMSVGSVLARPALKRIDLWTLLLYVELILCSIGLLSGVLIRLAHMLFSYLFIWDLTYLGNLVFFASAFGLSAAVGALTGLELPLLMEVGKRISSNEQVKFSVLAFDYFGSLLGAVSFPLLLLPNLELIWIGLLIASLNLLMALSLWLISFDRTKVRRVIVNAVPCCTVAALFAVFSANAAWMQQYFLRKYYYYIETSNSLKTLIEPMAAFPKILRTSSAYQKIDIVKDTNPDASRLLTEVYSNKLERNPSFPADYYLFLNGDFQFNSSYEEIYHEYFAHVPIVAIGNVPEHVLVLGGGDGILIRELVKYPEIESITHIDIEDKLIELARKDLLLSKINNRSLHDPRVRTRISDAYQYARKAEAKFDAIYIDFPAPSDYNLAKLYSREFFSFVRGLMTPDGFVVFDSTGTGILSMPDEQGSQTIIDGNDWPIYYNTLKKAGFPEIIPYVTTLEIDEAILDALAQDPNLQLSLDPGTAQLFMASDSDQEKSILVRAALYRILLEHVMALQQGFIIMANHPVGKTTDDFKSNLNFRVLNAKRYELAFQVQFPKSEHIDEQLVNSILRPTFPTIPLWQPKLPL